MKRIKKFNENLELGTEVLSRVNKLVDFLDTLPEDAKISAGDTYGYIMGFFGEDDKPEDEIEVFAR